MKNNFITFIILSILTKNVMAENLSIKALDISIDKKTQTTIFKNNVVIEDEIGNIIKSNYAEYDKKNNIIYLKKNIIVNDKDNNILRTEQATYNEMLKMFKTNGKTKFESSLGYTLEGTDISLNNKNKTIFSNNYTTLNDLDGNTISLENFEYISSKKIFKSLGKIEVNDSKNNTYLFSQIIIDTKSKEMIGTDVKAYLNDEMFKFDKKNKPRIFANTAQFKQSGINFQKSAFTFCNYRKGDKCPPWEFTAREMNHDEAKKTIFYENVLIKIYNVPVMYLPYFFHPDPTVKRRSGFLTPSFKNVKSLGASTTIPYFYAINDDKDLTISNKIFMDHHPLIISEYRQAFKDSSLIIDFGYTEGLKKSDAKKETGERSHSFLRYVKNFKETNRSKELELNLENVSNRKYLKTYKIQSELINSDENTLENYLRFSSTGEDDFYGIETTIFKSLKKDNSEKYEYILPNASYSKNFINTDSFGNIDFTSNFKIENNDTNKTKKILINDFSWNYKDLFLENGLKSRIFSEVKNVNYEAKNIEGFKSEPTSEVFGALGYLSEIDFYKDIDEDSRHLLTPKILLRYAPGNMKQETNGGRINNLNIFNLNRTSSKDNFENGLSATLGFDYEIDNKETKFSFSGGQVINQKENKKMYSESSLNEKLSDFVGSTNFNYNDKFNFDYKFALDQNYKDLNYNDFNTTINFNSVDLNFNYLKEAKHYGQTEFFETNVSYLVDTNEKLSIKGKRNLISNSAEYYDLSYEYFNDCLRAGLVYRREFYNDSEVEPEDSLMFKITLIPFGNLSSQTISK
jgi:LPS-assembly protein